MRRYLLPRLGDVVFIAVFAGALLLGSRMLNADADLGRHLTLGKYTLDTRTIPNRDLLSFTMSGQARPPYEWMAQVGFAVSDHLLDLDGIVLLTSFALAVAFLVIYHDAVQRTQAPLLALLLTSVSAAASSLHWIARPHVFSFVLFAIWLRSLERVRNGENSQLWHFPVLMCIWANTHGGFVFGILAWGAYFAGWLWSYLRRTTGILLGLRLLVIGAASLVASMLTPDLWHNWDGVLNNRSAYILSQTLETMPPNYSVPGTWPFVGLLALAALALLLNARRLAAAHVFLLGGLAAASAAMARNIPFFALAAPPILASWLLPALEQRPRWINRERGFGRIDQSLRGGVWPAIAVITTTALFAYHSSVTHTPLYSWNPNVLPVAAANWVGDHPLAGNMFNDLNWGGYLLFKLWPGQRVFIDSQTDFYGEALTHEYAQIMTAGDGWRAYLAQSHIRWIIVPPASRLASGLWDDASWQILYTDPTAVIFARRQGP